MDTARRKRLFNWGFWLMLKASASAGRRTQNAVVGRGRALNEYQTYGRTQTVTAYRKGSIPIASPTTSHLRRPSSTTAPATKSTLTRSSGSGFEGQPRPLPIPRRNVSWTIQFCAPYEASVDQTNVASLRHNLLQNNKLRLLFRGTSGKHADM